MDPTKLLIYGSSDDLVEFEGKVTATYGPGDRGFDKAIASDGAEFNLYLGRGETDRGGFFDIVGSDGTRFHLHPIYPDNGCWGFAVTQHDEGVGIGGPVSGVWTVSTANQKDMPSRTLTSDRENYTTTVVVERAEPVEWTIAWMAL